MATVAKLDENRWVVHMGSPGDSCVTVEVNMSLETAGRIAEKETERLAALNPDRDDIGPETVGSAVLSVLGQFAAGGKPWSVTSALSISRRLARRLHGR